MDRMPHESFTILLYFVGASAIAIALVVVFLVWRHGRKSPKRDEASPRRHRGSGKRRRRR
jgi:hypothetical protein